MSNPRLYTDNYYALRKAIYAKDIKTIKLIFKNKVVDIDYSDEFELTPLHWAADSGEVKIVKYLIDAKADVNALRPYNPRYSPILEMKHSLNKEDIVQQTPLHRAARLGHKKCVRAFLDAGAYVNVKNDNGDTSLHMAVRSGNEKIVQALLDAKAKGRTKANVNASNNNGDTPLLEAAFYGNAKIVQTLLDAGANVNVSNKQSQNPLHRAADLANEQTVQALLEAGVDLSLRDINAKLPFELFIESNRIQEAFIMIDRMVDQGMTMPDSLKGHFRDAWNARFALWDNERESLKQESIGELNGKNVTLYDIIYDEKYARGCMKSPEIRKHIFENHRNYKQKHPLHTRLIKESFINTTRIVDCIKTLRSSKGASDAKDVEKHEREVENIKTALAQPNISYLIAINSDPKTQHNIVKSCMTKKRIAKKSCTIV